MATSHPPEVWAAVMEHLDFASVLSLTAVSRAAPLVTVYILTNHIRFIAVGRRFRDVQDVFIDSFIKSNVAEGALEEDAPELVIDSETCLQVVPFLTTSFCNLKRVKFCGLDTVVDFEDEHSNEYLGWLIDSISIAFKCWALCETVVFKGLICPELLATAVHRAPCKVCKRAVNSFPVASVAAFQSMEDDITYGTWHNDLCVCLSKDELVSRENASTL